MADFIHEMGDYLGDYAMSLTPFGDFASKYKKDAKTKEQFKEELNHLKQTLPQELEQQFQEDKKKSAEEKEKDRLDEEEIKTSKNGQI